MSLKRWMRFSWRTALKSGLVGCLLAVGADTALAQGFVPGSGTRVAKVGDTFENTDWTFIFNLPKSSEENDKQTRPPGGVSKNGRWYEGVMRGQPDVIERVVTPEGGIPGSLGSLLIRSRATGVPGHFSGKSEQDDLIVDVHTRLGGPISVSRSPSVVTHVYVPQWEKFEQRNGVSFGFRAACLTHKPAKKKPGRWRSGGGGMEPETYWPGMFITFNRGDAKTSPSAQLLIRSGPSGHDFAGPKISSPGWWTLGMSFTPDGAVHYYGHQGIDPLTSADHLSSQHPYSYRAEALDAFFFNVVSGDNGNWSTPWVIDDALLYIRN